MTKVHGQAWNFLVWSPIDRECWLRVKSPLSDKHPLLKPLEHRMQSTNQARHWPVGGAQTVQVGASPALDFRSIYERWFDEVSGWIRAMGGPEADREDLVQDVFCVVHRRLVDFDGNNLPGWLYQIARHRVRDFRRLLWVKHLLFGGVPLSDSLIKAGPSPADSLETKEKRALLERLLRRLNDSERAALVLFEIDGYSGEEIAEIQGVPLNTVWARVHSARKKLRASLARIESRENGRRKVRQELSKTVARLTTRETA